MHTATRSSNVRPESATRKLARFKLKAGAAFILLRGSLPSLSLREDWEAFSVAEDDDYSWAVGAVRLDGVDCVVFHTRAAAHVAQPLTALNCVEV